MFGPFLLWTFSSGVRGISILTGGGQGKLNCPKLQCVQHLLGDFHASSTWLGVFWPRGLLRKNLRAQPWRSAWRYLLLGSGDNLSSSSVTACLEAIPRNPRFIRLSTCSQPPFQVASLFLTSKPDSAIFVVSLLTFPICYYRCSIIGISVALPNNPTTQATSSLHPQHILEPHANEPASNRAHVQTSQPPNEQTHPTTTESNTLSPASKWPAEN